jgi:hypothetical protein
MEACLSQVYKFKKLWGLAKSRVLSTRNKLIALNDVVITVINTTRLLKENER